MRLFVSVDLSDELADSIAEVQDRFAEANGLRFTDPKEAHITLKFLGEVSEIRLQKVDAAIQQAIETVDVTPFHARFGGLGVFPTLNYISVVWFGVEEGSDQLIRLHEVIEEEMVDLGFSPEDHDFTPHVTLARMDHAGGKELVQELVTEWDPTIGEMRVSEVRLTESTLTSSGPEYSTVERYPLE